MFSRVGRGIFGYAQSQFGQWKEVVNMATPFQQKMVRAVLVGVGLGCAYTYNKRSTPPNASILDSSDDKFMKHIAGIYPSNALQKQFVESFTREWLRLGSASIAAENAFDCVMTSRRGYQEWLEVQVLKGEAVSRVAIEVEALHGKVTEKLAKLEKLEKDVAARLMNANSQSYFAIPGKIGNYWRSNAVENAAIIREEIDEVAYELYELKETIKIARRLNLPVPPEYNETLTLLENAEQRARKLRAQSAEVIEKSKKAGLVFGGVVAAVTTLVIVGSTVAVCEGLSRLYVERRREDVGGQNVLGDPPHNQPLPQIEGGDEIAHQVVLDEGGEGNDMPPQVEELD